MKERIRKKGLGSSCHYRVVCVALDGKNRPLAVAANHPRFSRQGGSVHAEINALKKGGPRTRKIVLARVGGSGFLPIEPCESCSRILERNGVSVIPLLSASGERLLK